MRSASRDLNGHRLTGALRCALKLSLAKRATSARSRSAALAIYDAQVIKKFGDVPDDLGAL
jgi:hypothetical protein